MKKTKVHLVSKALAINNNQSHFVTNQYKDLLEEQKSINQNLMNFASQINTSCQTILRDIHKQESALHLQKRTRNNNYIYLRNLLLETVETSKSYEIHFNKQDKAIYQLQQSFNRQRNFLNNLSIKQNDNYQTLSKQLEEYTQKLNNFQEQKNHYENLETLLEQTLLEHKKHLEEIKILLKKNDSAHCE
ncbi:hypothetical protein [Psychrobacillus sp.]|uniref:hypothetical protein n=1 Tax=Psychrobacillus sp. TaxID=1871623 RepID=UPI0028BD49D6|nr:hypothetical protein [Psychrobacillus sp.]